MPRMPPLEAMSWDWTRRLGGTLPIPLPNFPGQKPPSWPYSLTRLQPYIPARDAKPCCASGTGCCNSSGSKATSAHRTTPWPWTNLCRMPRFPFPASRPTWWTAWPPSIPARPSPPPSTRNCNYSWRPWPNDIAGNLPEATYATWPSWSSTCPPTRS